MLMVGKHEVEVVHDVPDIEAIYSRLLPTFLPRAILLSLLAYTGVCLCICFFTGHKNATDRTVRLTHMSRRDTWYR